MVLNGIDNPAFGLHQINKSALRSEERLLDADQTRKMNTFSENNQIRSQQNSERNSDKKQSLLIENEQSLAQQQLEREKEKERLDQMLKYQDRSFQLIKDLLYLITPGMEQNIEADESVEHPAQHINTLS